MISIRLPSTVGPKSSTASRAAATEPSPLPSLYCPLMSVMMPIRSTSPSARAAAGARSAVAAQSARSIAPARRATGARRVRAILVLP